MPSPKHTETVCTAGIDEQGNWYRLYPIPFRYIQYSKQFSKYQWIEVEISPVDQKWDYRKESYRPKVDSIKPISEALPAGTWNKRKQLVLPTVSPSLEFLSSKFHDDGTSLGIFKPKSIEDFIVEKSDGQWKGKKAMVQSQLKLFDPQPKRLEKIPYNFYYRFKCEDSSCKGHKLSIHDWEIFALYLNLKNRYQYASDEILEKIKHKWLDEMWSPKKDSYLMVGTVHSRYKQPIWVVLGVFWPPKQ